MIFEQILNIPGVYFDLGPNTYTLYEKLKPVKNSTIVDLGVRHGFSSSIFLEDSEINNNKVYGVDLGLFELTPLVKSHKNFTFIQNDSIIAGNEWKNGPVNFLFVDTIHIKEQVLGELESWMPHVPEGSIIAFHDTNWGEGHYENFKGITWHGRPDDAIKEYFNIDLLNFENDYIKVENYPESYGMTFIYLKKKDSGFGKNVDWEAVKKYHLFSLS